MKRIWILSCAALCAPAIDVPSIGILVDPSGVLRSVHGVAGNFLLGAPAASGILSAACSAEMCLAKTDSKILSADGETAAPPGAAVFGFDGEQAIVYFPQTRSFARWHSEILDPLDWSVEGEVLSVRARGETVEVAVRRDADVCVIRPDGSVVDWIASTSGPALLLADGVLFATADSVLLRRTDGTEIQFPLAAAETITQMGPNYAAVRVEGATYALRTDPGLEQLFLLPAPPQDLQ